MLVVVTFGDILVNDEHDLLGNKNKTKQTIFNNGLSIDFSGFTTPLHTIY